MIWVDVEEQNEIELCVNRAGGGISPAQYKIKQVVFV